MEIKVPILEQDEEKTIVVCPECNKEWILLEWPVRSAIIRARRKEGKITHMLCADCSERKKPVI